MLQHTIAAVALKIAYLAAGVILAFIGKGLLEKGISGGFRGEGEIASNKFRIVTSSPGLVFLVAGLTIVVVAIINKPKFTQTDETGNVAQVRQGVESLKELSRKTTVTSVLAEPSPQDRFALSQYNAAVRFARNNNKPAAVTYLVRALVLQPRLLQRALESKELAQAVQDPVFESIVKGRFKLPLEVPPIPASANRSIPGMLRMYIAIKSPGELRKEEVTYLLSAMPQKAQQEPIQATFRRLQSVLSRNPQALLGLLEDPRFEWILEDEAISDSLYAGVSALIRS